MIGRLIGRLNVPLSAIIAEGFLSRLSFGMINFALPLYALSLGMSLSQIGLLVSLRLGVGLALTPLAGWAADVFGRKRLLLTGLAARSTVALLFTLAGVPWHLFAIRTLHGASTAARDPSASSLIADYAHEGKRASAFAWQGTARSTGGALGAAFAGGLVGLTAADYHLVFGAAFAVSLIPLALTAALVSEESEDNTSKASEPGQAEQLAPDADKKTIEARAAPPLAPLALLGFMISGTSQLVHGLFPVLATEYAGLSAAQAGMIYAASALAMMVSGPAFGWVADTRGTKPVFLVRSLANTMSSVLYLVSPNLTGVTLGYLADGTGKAAFRPAWGATMAQVSSYDRSRQTRRMARLDMGREGGETFGPLLGGLIWDIWGIATLLVVRIILAVAVEGYALIVGRRFSFGAPRPNNWEEPRSGLIVEASDSKIGVKPG